MVRTRSGKRTQPTWRKPKTTKFRKTMTKLGKWTYGKYSNPGYNRRSDPIKYGPLLKSFATSIQKMVRGKAGRKKGMKRKYAPGKTAMKKKLDANFVRRIFNYL